MRLITTVLATLAMTGGAFAIDAGGFAFQQHYHQLLQQQTAPNNIGPSKKRKIAPRAAKQQQMQAEIAALHAKHRRELEPEYNRRVHMHGKRAADTWLRKEAERRGRQTAIHIKRKYGLN